MKDKIKKEYMFLGGVMLLALGIVGMYFFNKSYALDDAEKIDINCDKEVAISGEEITCSITGMVSSYQVSALESQVNLSDNLEFVSFTVDNTTTEEDDTWQGTGDDGNIQLYINNKTSTFSIGELKVKVKDDTSITNSDSITLENTIFYDEQFKENVIENATYSIGNEYLNINNLDVDEDDNIIYNLDINDTYTELFSNIDTSGTITVLDKNGNKVDESNNLRTGDIIQIKLNSETIEYKISVLGDVTSDGKVSFSDVTSLYQYYSAVKDISREEKIATIPVTVNIQKSQSIVYESYSFDEEKGVFNLTGSNTAYSMFDQSEFTTLSGMVGRGNLKYVCDDFNSSSCTKMYELTALVYNNIDATTSTLTYIEHSVKKSDYTGKYALTKEEVLAGDIVEKGRVGFNDVSKVYRYHAKVITSFK